MFEINVARILENLADESQETKRVCKPRKPRISSLKKELLKVRNAQKGRNRILSIYSKHGTGTNSVHIWVNTGRGRSRNWATMKSRRVELPVCGNPQAVVKSLWARGYRTFSFATVKAD